jgi:ABC-2 type transport system ATP-binding protein
VHEIRDLLSEHPHHVRVECDKPRELAARVLAATAGVSTVTFPSPSEVEFLSHDPDDTYSTVAKQAIEGGFEIKALTSPDATLEALFHYLVERSAGMAGTGADAAQGRAKGVGAKNAPKAAAGKSKEAGA